MASTIKVDQIEGSTGSTITVPTGQTLTLTDGLASASLPVVGVAKGGTSFASFTAGDVLYATGSTTLAKLPKGTAEQVLAMNAGATAPDWGSVDLTVLPTISVAKGGTALSSFTAGDILYATGTTTLAKLAKGTAAQALVMNAGATAPEWVAPASGTLKAFSAMTPKTGRWTQSTSSSWLAINDGSSDFAVTITPEATTNKILLDVSIGSYIPNNSSYNYGSAFKLYRSISGGAAGYPTEFEAASHGSRPQASWKWGIEAGTAAYQSNFSAFCVDTSHNATTAITYTLHLRNHGTGSLTACFNHNPQAGSTSGGQDANTISNFTAMALA